MAEKKLTQVGSDVSGCCEVYTGDICSLFVIFRRDGGICDEREIFHVIQKVNLLSLLGKTVFVILAPAQATKLQDGGCAKPAKSERHSIGLFFPTVKKYKIFWVVDSLKKNFLLDP